MKKIIPLFICCLLLFSAVGCGGEASSSAASFESDTYGEGSGEASEILESDAFDEISGETSETAEEPAETQNGTLKELVSPLISDDRYNVSRIFWSGNEKLFIWQCEKGYDSHKNRLIQYDAASGEERLFFEWENERYDSEVFLTEDGLKVYSDHCLYVLDKNGEITEQVEYDTSPVLASFVSVYGDDAEEYQNDGTYVINLLTGPRLKLFDSSEEEYYQPWRWSPDGEYLILFRNQLKTVHDPGQEPDSYFEGTEMVVVNRDGDLISRLPTPESSYCEWLSDSHVIGMQIYNETNDIVAIKVVDAVSGKTLGNYTPTENEYVNFEIGKRDCVLLIDAVTYDENSSPAECDTYIYNYRNNEKEFFCKFYEYPGRVLFSPDGLRAAIVAGYKDDIYLYDDL